MGSKSVTYYHEVVTELEGYIMSSKTEDKMLVMNSAGETLSAPLDATKKILYTEYCKPKNIVEITVLVLYIVNSLSRF